MNYLSGREEHVAWSTINKMVYKSTNKSVPIVLKVNICGTNSIKRPEKDSEILLSDR